MQTDIVIIKYSYAYFLQNYNKSQRWRHHGPRLGQVKWNTGKWLGFYVKYFSHSVQHFVVHDLKACSLSCSLYSSGGLKNS